MIKLFNSQVKEIYNRLRSRQPIIKIFVNISNSSAKPAVFSPACRLTEQRDKKEKVEN